ncbi:hypothetical protein BJF93_04420 [Xaviernesmea oryzae]|uniref:DUF982 domain-containing protein n=1 Tax=Xaviernesmea oryzae TaxID=464029 RepID=A0A1Q9AUL2_9HYPH|nr:DUF982 domain-containing protein [Xaviernesmea oryzae]OLP59157.1 hypothetical protein BJF93_04420 [Xaviernesmea oryzae]SEK83937.1 Protein of unknown function [Xaviernesmea oryzae]
MAEKCWRRPVIIELNGVGAFEAVCDTQEATRILLKRWPQENKGPAYETALKTCHYVLLGEQAPDYARHDFIAAAHEALIYVRQDQA